MYYIERNFMKEPVINKRLILTKNKQLIIIILTSSQPNVNKLNY